MALKDKLMTLEDFKAVRDVDVASNSAQFTEIKADLEEQRFTPEAKDALLACLRKLPFMEDDNSYKVLKLALNGTPFRAVTGEDISSHVGYRDIAVSDGTATAESVASFSVMVYDADFIRFKVPLENFSNRFVFRKDGNNYYGNAGAVVHLFTLGTGKYSASDVTSQNVATITYYNGWNGALVAGREYDISLDTENHILTLADANGTVMTVTNANCIGYWGANNATGIGWKFINARVLNEDEE